MKFATITAAITLLAVATTALPHGGSFNVGGSNNKGSVDGILDNLAQGGVLANNPKKSSVTGSTHGRRGYDHDHGHHAVNVGGSNNEGPVNGILNNALEGGVLANNGKESNVGVHKRGWDHYDHDHGHHREVNVGGSNNEGPVNGILNNALEGGVLANNAQESNVGVYKRGWDHYDHDHGHHREVNVGGSNNEGPVGGLLNNLAKGGVLANNGKESNVGVHKRGWDHYDHDHGHHREVNVGGSNNEGPVNGILNNALEGGVLANNGKESNVGVYKRGWDHYDHDHHHREVNVGGSNNEGKVGGLLNNLAKGGVLANNAKESHVGVYKRGWDHYDHDYDHDHHHREVNIGGNNNEGRVDGILNNALEGGVLADNSKEANTNVRD